MENFSKLKLSTIYIKTFHHTNLHILSNDKSLDPRKILGVSPQKHFNLSRCKFHLTWPGWSLNMMIRVRWFADCCVSDMTYRFSPCYPSSGILSAIHKQIAQLCSTCIKSCDKQILCLLWDCHWQLSLRPPDWWSVLVRAR